uniref:NR LBD domain-containing protein n=1 Tax=Panagrolaimus sp. JU765 TaxID=591449 RepID=A0AC34RTC2_9BILA
MSSSPTEPSPLENWNRNIGRSEVRIEGRRVIYDSQPLVAVIKESLLQSRSSPGNLPSGVILTPMQKMCAAVTKFMNSLKPKIGEIQVVTEIGVDCGMKFQEEYLLKLTEMVTSCNYFTNLPDSDKWPIFKRFWSIFQQIERAYQTIQVFGNEINDYRFLIDDKKAVDMDVAKLKFADPNIEMDNVLKLFEPIKDRVFQHFLNPMKQVRPTSYELAYMTQQVLWSCFEISGLLPSTYRIAEEVMERNANELHNYYVYEMHISNYAARH